MSARGFFDATCPKCGRKIGWLGTLRDKPPCNGCGHADDPEETARIESVMAQAHRDVFGDDKENKETI